MRHGNKVKKLGKVQSHRNAMLGNLACSILEKGLAEDPMKRAIRTTVPKAKVVRSLVERLITYAKNGDLSSRRQAAKVIMRHRAPSIQGRGEVKQDLLQSLFDVLAKRYKDRQGGYTRILKLSSPRHGDNADMCIISLVEDEVKSSGKKKTPAKKASKPRAKKSQDAAEGESAPSEAPAAEAAPKAIDAAAETPKA